MKTKYRWLGLTLALALAACGHPPLTQAPTNVPGATLNARGVLQDAERYPDGNHYRVMALQELPIVNVTADSSASGYPASNITDGDLATQWANGGYKNATAWAAVQLSASASLGSIGIKTGPSPAGTSYDVQVSDDGSTWNTVLASQTNSTWGLETKTLPAGTTGTYVRILWHNSPSNPQPHFAIFELEVNGSAGSAPSPTPTPSVAPSPSPTPTPMPSTTPTPLNSPTPTPMPSATSTPSGTVSQLMPTSVFASDTYSGLTPQRATDGNLTTQWANGGYQESEATLTLQFGQVCSFDHIVIKTGALPSGVSYTVETSSDGTNWSAASGSLTNTTWNMETRPVSGQGSYLRIHFHNNPSAPMARFSIFEVQAFGTSGAANADASFPLVQAPGGQQNLQLAENSQSHEFLASWIDESDTNNNTGAVYVRLLHADGTPATAPVNLTPGPGLHFGATVVYSPDANAYLVLWHDDPNSAPGAQASIDVLGQVVSATGQPVGNPLLLTPNTAGSNQLYPQAAYDATTHQFLVVWQDDRLGGNTAYGQFLDAHFNLVGGNFSLRENAPSQWYPTIACSAASNHYLLAWEDDSRDQGDVYAQVLDGSGNALGGTIPVGVAPNRQESPQIAYNWRDDQFLLAWLDLRDAPSLDIESQRLDASGQLLGGNTALVLRSPSLDGPLLAYNGQTDEYLLGFDLYGSTSGQSNHWGIFARTLDHNGAPEGTSYTTVADQNYDHRLNSIAFDYTSNRYLLGWMDARNDTGDLYGRWLP